MTRVGLILSGCGFQDGAEIQEAVVAMLALEEEGAIVVPFAPAKPQAVVIDHATGERDAGASRSVLAESARIVRGNVRDVATARADELDAVVLPGGYGAAQNLCDFAAKGAGMTVEPGTARLLREMRAAGKPIGAICIAPVILAKLFGAEGATVTIGTDAATAKAVEAMGATHVPCAVTDCVVDQSKKLVTTPAYMLAETVRDIHQGIRKLARAVIQLTKEG